ncbi:hypothetical protein PENTCL1PPCAC_22638, partial [Pristionchus entomophagus]
MVKQSINIIYFNYTQLTMSATMGVPIPHNPCLFYSSREAHGPVQTAGWFFPSFGRVLQSSSGFDRFAPRLSVPLDPFLLLFSRSSSSYSSSSAFQISSYSSASSQLLFFYFSMFCSFLLAAAAAAASAVASSPAIVVWRSEKSDWREERSAESPVDDLCLHRRKDRCFRVKKEKRERRTETAAPAVRQSLSL